MATILNGWQRHLGRREAELVTMAVDRHRARVSLDDCRNEIHISMTANAFCDITFGIVDKLNFAHQRATELMVDQLVTQKAIIDSVEMKDKQHLIEEVARLTDHVKRLEVAASVADRVMESILGEQGEAE